MRGHAQRLERPDKCYLGAGDGLVHAPAFPQWLEAPGIWDEAHLFQYAVGPLFTISILERGRVLPARSQRRAWTPDALTVRHALGGIQAVERRSAPGGRTLRSSWTLRHRAARPRVLDLVVWTAWPGEDVEDDGVDARDGALSLTRRLRDRTGHEARVTMSMALAPRARTWAAYRSEGSVAHPRFDLSPFADRWTSRGLGREIRLQGISPQGLVYAALHRRLALPPSGSASFQVDARLSLGDVPNAAAAKRRRALRSGGWESFLRGVPALQAGQPLFEWAWWNRWYGLRLNRIEAIGQYAHPSVCEGIGYFHQPIAYSAPAHAREVRWAHDPTWAHGVLRTFLGHLDTDGSMPGRIYVDHLERRDFYHGDWGAALEAVLVVHPDDQAAHELFEALARYAAWLLATRDVEGSGMIDVVDQYETGQEYMSRYLAVDPDADRYGWENQIRLKGIDATVYAYRTLRALERWERSRLAPSRPGSGVGGEWARPSWQSLAARTGRAIRERMWDPEQGMFSDVDPRTGARTRVKAAVCFYPYLTDLVGEEHLPGLEAHLFNPREFWTPFPVPSSSADDPLFNPDAEWRGKRHHCPWNGRVWPMANSHMAETLARVVRTLRRDWAPYYGHFLRRFLTMMTFDGRADRPNAFEHYHPMNGRPSVYRGVDDYQHSWINDLIVCHVFGLEPLDHQWFLVDPIPVGLGRAALRDIPYRGVRIGIRLRGTRLEVTVDGRRAAAGRVGGPLEVRL